MEIAVIILILILLVAVCVILPPSMGKVSPPLNEDWKITDRSILEKVFIEINGIKQGMFIRGKNKNNPVLLLIHGGPGMSDYFLAKEYSTALEEEFVVCYWEQRGTGLSYNLDIAQDTMTTEQFVDDTIGVTNYMRNRFEQDKIYLMGHSWGTYLGINVAAKAPELYQAYIAMSQIVNQPESERLAYDYMMEQYTLAGNSNMVKQLERYPIITSDKALEEYIDSLVRDKAMHELGVGTMHQMHSVIRDIFFPSLRCTDYTPLERIHIWSGKIFSIKTGLRGEEYAFDAKKDVLALEIPVYFFAGRYDYTVCYSLQKEYYEELNAPLKGFYSFENSAHSPLFEEPRKAIQIMKTDVLKGIKTLADE